ncbi:MAG: dihydropteroate synthase [Candidatus Omnitrophota bacterium]
MLNVTPDSFSDGGLYADAAAALDRALEMEHEGADIIDVGAESTRPGADPVCASEEIRRLKPVLHLLRKKCRVPLSVDTTKSEVMQLVMDEGVEIINDISALSCTAKTIRRLARYKVSVILMHKQGDPKTMQKAPRYGDVVEDVRTFLKSAVRRAVDNGIDARRIIVDPGFGFGKTAEHNHALLRRLEAIGSLGLPVLAGLSRKSFIGLITGGDPLKRLEGTLAAGAIAIQKGAHLLRVHDVRAHRQMADVIDKILFSSSARIV